MAGSSRKFHTKSRNGCGQCKKRHIKCDGRPPVCGNCARRKLDCDYKTFDIGGGCLVSNRPYASLPTPSASPPALVRLSSESPAISLPPPVASGLDYHDLFLMHHYTTTTFQALGPVRSPRVSQFWQNQVPDIAQAHHFLMHNVLAVSALHVAYLTPQQRSKYCRISVGHYNKALGLFRSSVTNIAPGHVSAIFASTVLVFVMSMGLPFIHGVIDNDVLDAFMAIISVLRRSFHFFVSVWEQELGTGTPGPWHFDILLGTYPIDDSTENALQALHTMAESSAKNPGQLATYRDTIQKLRTSFQYTSLKPRMWGRTIFWPRSVSEEYVALLHEKQPLALALLAHWCVPVFHAPHRWYVDNWPERVIKTIAQSLGPSWEAIMKWPLDQIKERTLVEEDIETSAKQPYLPLIVSDLMANKTRAHYSGGMPNFAQMHASSK